MMRGNNISLLLFFSLLLAGPAQAQDTTFARRMMDTLCSPYFGGRGYTIPPKDGRPSVLSAETDRLQGVARAAAYLNIQFRQLGLTPAMPDRPGMDILPYSIPFSIQTVVFQEEIIVKVDGVPLKPGADYLLDPESGNQKSLKTSKLYRLDSLTADAIGRGKAPEIPEKRALVLDEKDYQAIRKAGKLHLLMVPKPTAIIIRVPGRLLWSVGSLQDPLPVVCIKADKLPANARKISLKIQGADKIMKGENVAGYIKGSGRPDSVIILCAHYDHLGQMGPDATFRGANDNASGVAMLLDLARHFSKPENKPRYSLLFVLFAGEEAGLVGSKNFVNYPPLPLDNISFVINMDLMGNGQDGMMAVNGSILPEYFAKLQSLNEKGHYLKEIKQRGKAANSDHYWFSEKGVKAFFFYLLGEYPWYHDIYDTPEKPTLAGYRGAFLLISDFMRSLQGK